MYLDVNQTTNQLVKKEGAVRLDFPLDETNRQNWLHNIPRHFENITRNTCVCIKHFEEKECTHILTYIQTMMDPHIG